MEEVLQKWKSHTLEPIREALESDESNCSLFGRMILLGAPDWRPEHRRAADRRGLHYPSDLIDARRAGTAGGRRSVNVREVPRCPRDLPPKDYSFAGTVRR